MQKNIPNNFFENILPVYEDIYKSVLVKVFKRCKNSRLSTITSSELYSRVDDFQNHLTTQSSLVHSHFSCRASVGHNSNSLRLEFVFP